VRELTGVLNRLKQDGAAIVFISHKLGEVLEVADRITVLRRGKKVDTVARAGATELSLARLVVGRDVLLRVEKPQAKPDRPLLEVRDLHVRDDRELEQVSGLSLSVRAGEIVALAGVDGNGQQELVDAITGLRAPVSGQVVVDGRDIAGRGVRAATDAGVAHIAQDRQLRGLVLPFTLAENLALREYRDPEYSAWGWLRIAYMKQRAQQLLGEFDVRGGGPDTYAAALSGGNQQKVCVAREIASDPKLLVAHQPTRGLDVGAIEFVHSRLIAERDRGRAVLLVSLEYEEVRALADRILVIYEGRIAGEFPPDASEEELGFAMTGGRTQSAEEVAN
jgi:general nucleoside transport system ATP-binding protein